MAFYSGQFFNVALAKEPLNWAIVFVLATFWLLFFHVVMTAFGAMQSGGSAQGAFAPGQLSSPVAGTTADFSTAGLLASSPPSALPGAALSSFYGAGGNTWTDGTESKYPEDGWTGNP